MHLSAVYGGLLKEEGYQVQGTGAGPGGDVETGTADHIS